MLGAVRRLTALSGYSISVVSWILLYIEVTINTSLDEAKCKKGSVSTQIL